MIKDRTKVLREYLQSITTKDMSAEQLEKHQSMINELDEVDKEDDLNLKEISDCKDQIVSLVKSQGSSNPPKDEPQKPRSLEEIAQATIGGK